MAAITAGVPSVTLEEFFAGHGKRRSCGPNKLLLITPGLFTPVPSVCTALSTVHHGNFFAIRIDEEIIHAVDNTELFLLDTRIAGAWNWMMGEAAGYLDAVVQNVGPFGSQAFTEATQEIGILPDQWLPFLAEGMVTHFTGPLSTPAPLPLTVYNARRAQEHLRAIYGFAALLRRLTIGQDVHFRCPEDSSNWRFHAIHCQAGIRPRIDVTDYEDQLPGNLVFELEEAKDLAIEQSVLADRFHGDLGSAEGRLVQIGKVSAQLKKRLDEAVSERDVLQTELGRAKAALSRTLKRLHHSEQYVTALEDDDFGNWVQAPLPDRDPVLTSPATPESFKSIEDPSSPTFDSDYDMKN
jgi:hypothetical protein